jgi:tRNA U54 and U55 pseudouridine synthase Pus10
MADGEAAADLQGAWTCPKCTEFLDQTFDTDSNHRIDTASSVGCCVCLGLWNHDEQLARAIDKACEPYGGMEVNRFSMKSQPSVSVPGDVALRYYLAALKRKNAQPLSTFLRHLKDHLKTVTLQHVTKRQQEVLQGYPTCVESEEQGFLCVHVILAPASDVSRPSTFDLPTKKISRKRFRGHDPTEKQGGDPRQNLERRLSKQSIELWSCAVVEAVLQGAVKETWKEWFRRDGGVSSSAVNNHVAVWRRPFFVRGLYTKSRRDVSQTPFFVPSDDDPRVMKRMGVTSVEEQINPVLNKVACGGISTLNNDPDGGDTVYSMIKFHASGREDLDVRMILPPVGEKGVGGRPFVLQVVDALRMPTMEQIKQVPCVINSNTANENNSEALCDDNELTTRRYGSNALGVDISDCFTFVPSIAFKNLQSETEEKVKFYGCLCWSEQEISSEDDLRTRLGSFPLQINQRTPIRVLHRRSNVVRVRHVLTLKPKWIDKHHFRLNLSTDAGTYVKEFVHGDLGRTVPSVSSLLGFKTDILELDCEGIAGV